MMGGPQARMNERNLSTLESCSPSTSLGSDEEVMGWLCNAVLVTTDTESCDPTASTLKEREIVETQRPAACSCGGCGGLESGDGRF